MAAASVVAAAQVHAADPQPAPPPASAGAASDGLSELDQLLSGMLLNVSNIPDIRPRQRDIDVDSIQVRPAIFFF